MLPTSALVSALAPLASLIQARTNVPSVTLSARRALAAKLRAPVAETAFTLACYLTLKL